MKFFVLILTLGLAISGCNKKKKNEWVSHGDPAELVKGTDLNYGVSSYPADFNFGSLILKDANSFVSQSPKLSPQAMIDSQDPDKRTLYKVYSNTTRTHVSNSNPLVIRGSYDGDTYEVSFRKSSSRVEMFQVTINGRQVSYDPQYSHVSFNTQNEMSILFYWSESKFLRLTRLILGPVTDQKPLELNKSYSYFAGKGQGIRHNKSKTLVVQDCFHSMPELSAGLLQAKNIWGVEISNQLAIRIDQPARCLPFSDLNSNGAYYIRNFRTSRADVLYNPGFVLPVGEGELSDTDMFILDDEFKRMYGFENYFSSFEEGFERMQSNPEMFTFGSMQKTQVLLLSTLIHEFGHILGLDHVLKGPASYMSYNWDERRGVLSTYDKAAIRELYK